MPSILAEQLRFTLGASDASAMDRLRRAQEGLLQAIEVAPEGLAVFDAEDRYLLWNARYAELCGPSAQALGLGVCFEDVLRAGLAHGQYPDAVGCEEQWLQARLANRALPYSVFEQKLLGDRWVRFEERRTANGGCVRVCIDISDLKQREESFRLMFEGNPLPMWVFDRETLNFLDVNDAALVKHGFSREQFLAMSLPDVNRHIPREDMRRMLSGGMAVCAGHKCCHATAGGSDLEVEIYAHGLVYGGRPATLAAIVDVTERDRAERELRRTREFLDTIIENIPMAVFVKDAKDSRYILLNRSSEDYYELPRDQMLGRTPEEIFPPDIARIVSEQDRRVVDTGTPMLRDEHPIEVGDRRRQRIVNFRKLPIADANGEPRYVVGVVEDVTERIASRARIAYLAGHDALTGLPNRTAFNEALSERLAQAQGASSSFAVLSLDVDRFKEVNDVFGHPVGDLLIRAVADRLTAEADGAFIARVGGDEFMVLTGQGVRRERVLAMAERLVEEIGKELAIDDYLLHVGLSVGIAIYPSDGADAARLLANADSALYRAKREGRGAVRFFELAMDQDLRERRALQHDLSQALDRNQLFLHFQPQATLDGRVVGFEALLRWVHPARGPISPDKFIPLAEESGLIVQIGEWVLREACREAAQWPAPLRVAVNLSPCQFQAGDLERTIHQILLETGLSPMRLEVEITEGVLIGDFASALSQLWRLKALGIRIAMDDFGTGYSSLSYLQSFPFDKIKIDRSFISNLETTPQSAEIVRAVLGLAHALHIPVIAEGVETERQRAFLAREACQEMQGYLVGRPSTIDQYRRLVGEPAEPRRNEAGLA